MSLDQLLEDITVSSRNQHPITSIHWWPETLPWGVATGDEGVVALFKTEVAALHYRLQLISQRLNVGWENP